jgi:hypothetical protein
MGTSAFVFEAAARPWMVGRRRHHKGRLPRAEPLRRRTDSRLHAGGGDAMAATRWRRLGTTFG